MIHKKPNLHWPSKSVQLTPFLLRHHYYWFNEYNLIVFIDYPCWKCLPYFKKGNNIEIIYFTRIFKCKMVQMFSGTYLHATTKFKCFIVYIHVHSLKLVECRIALFDLRLKYIFIWNFIYIRFFLFFFKCTDKHL